MPRLLEPDNPTPFARLLLAYMWHREGLLPPLTTGQMAAKLHTSRQNVNNWVYSNLTPSFERMIHVLRTLGIPLSALEREYLADGLPSPIPPGLRPDEDDEDTRSAPEPRQPTASSTPKITAPPDPWVDMMGTVSAAMREAGMDEATIRAVIEHIQQRHAGDSPLQRNIVAEHSPATDADTTTTRNGSSKRASTDPLTPDSKTRRAPHPSRPHAKPREGRRASPDDDADDPGR